MDLLRPAALVVLLAGCTSEVEVQTTPVTVTVPVTGAALDSYAEVAVDIPPHGQGDIRILSLAGDVVVVNPSNATTMNFSLRVSTEGTADPDTLPVVTYNELTLPEYFPRATVVLPNSPYGPGSRTDVQIDGSALLDLINEPRIYLIVGNTITNLGLGDVYPVEVRLEDLTFNVIVEKQFGTVGGAQELSGL